MTFVSQYGSAEKPASDTVAVWLYNTIEVIAFDTSFPSYQVMLEHAYEDAGFPILEFGEDLAWVKVTYNCYDSLGSSIGWIHVDPDVHFVKTWSQIPADKYLFFRHNEDIRFFPSPNADSQLANELVERTYVDRFGKQHRPLDYIMYPQRVDENWMEVILETPSTCCVDADNPKRFCAWIRFLDDNKRPLVFYHTRGC